MKGWNADLLHFVRFNHTVLKPFEAVTYSFLMEEPTFWKNYFNSSAYISGSSEWSMS